VPDRTQTSVFEFPRPKRSEQHPTMKPVELVKKHIENSSDPGQIIIDQFGGSGTTLIAAEQTGRNALLMEIDGRFCDVIVERWQEFSGRRAVRVAAGEAVVEGAATETIASEAAASEAVAVETGEEVACG